MIKFFIKHPVTTIMFVLFWVVLGVVSFPKMNVESRPDIDFPMVTATFVYPGASPDEMESQVVKKAEDAISQVAGLKKITSQIFESGAMVMAEFNIGVNVNDKANEVKGKIDALSNDFPTDMKAPVIEKLNVLQEPVVNIVLSGPNPRDLSQFVDDVLSQQITALPGVASVNVFGGRDRAIRIALNPERMAARGIGVNDIVGTMAANNLNIPGGKIESGPNSNIVRFVGEFATVPDIAAMKITTAEGENFKLSDIANITDSARDKDTGARYQGADVVMVSVIKASDGNAIRISSEIHKNLPRLQNLMTEYFKNGNFAAPADPSAVPTMQIVSDTSTAVLNETWDTIYGIILGLALTVATLYFFTRNWRTTVIASVVIPASFISGFFFMSMSGFTINAMTLLAMATALGTLIMDAIVLIESALVLIEQGHTPEEAAELGTKKVTIRIFATIATHVVVFLPLAFMGGIAGQFMKQFGISVVFLVLLSSMFSFTLTPMMIAKILRPTKKKETKFKISKLKFGKRKNKPEDAAAADMKSEESKLSWFRKFYDYQMAHPWRIVGLSFVVLVLSATLMRWVGSEFAPTTDVDKITITARTAAGSTYVPSQEVAKLLESRLSAFKEVSYAAVKIGERGTENISIDVGLLPRAERGISDKLLMQKMLPALSDIPGVEIQIATGQKMGMNASDMVMNVTGPDDAKRDAYAAQAIQILNQIPEVQSAVLADQIPGNELKFVPDPAKMKYYGVRNTDAAVALRTALFGNDSSKYKEAGKEYPILIEFGKAYQTKASFDNIFVGSPKGLVALNQLGAVVVDRATPNIRRINKERLTEIDINIGKSTIGPVQKEIQQRLSKIDWAPEYGVSFGGMSEMQSDSTGEIGVAFLLATILTYMVLAAIMNSFLQPFTIATSILFSFAGVFIFLFLTGASINIAAMLSFVMLVGLAVSNNILLLEPTILRVENGESAPHALWSEFVDKRRVLLMTTVAVVAGMVPQLWSADGIKLSMAAVIIGGILASLFWTFAMTPAMFMAMEHLRNRKKKHRSE